jgi:tetratricopeptide (TPR) repeat protein
MNKRIAVIGGAAVLFAVILGAWLQTAGPEPRLETIVPEAPASLPVPLLPVPPVPPRIASGADYEHCLEMIDADPAGANSFADAWEATGGGDGAAHCRALALIALGDPETGAQVLDQLGGASHAPALARASVYGQAVQAWLMADEPDRAYEAATAAVALSPDDADLRIDRSVAAATMERYLDAIDDLDRAIALDPRRFDALVLRAAAWRQEKRLDRAKEDVDRALAINPDYPEALLERGILRQRMGDRAGARADWEHAIELAPDSTTADLAQQNLALLEAGPERK